MALVLGDVHGRLDKVKAFLVYRPEEKHVFTGDYVDSFVQADHTIYETLKQIIEADAIACLGNHDIHYLTNAPFRCSGYRQYMAKSINEILESYIYRFVPAAIEDGYVITHGGISNGLGNSILHNTDPVVILDTLNLHWQGFLRTRKARSLPISNESVIFNIPKSRGGMHKFGGIFWADYRDEEFYGIPQVFGHSKTPDGVMQVKLGHWALGCDDNKFECFNTATKEVEHFGEGETKDAA